MSTNCDGSCENSVNDGVSHRAARPLWLRGCLLLVAIGLALMVSLCSLSGLAIRRELIRPRWIVRRVGPVQLVARSTITPECALEFPCGKPMNVFDPNLRTYYVVWIIMSWPGPDKPSISKYRLVMQPIGER
jgi:hypothetical protein